MRETWNRLLGAVVLIFVATSFRYVNTAAVMSIDLGSEWMKVGIVSPGVPMEIALNKESKRKTPAVLSFRDNTRTFGEDAQNIGLRFPANSFGYLTDLLGKSVDNPIVDLYKKRFPYYNIEADPLRNTVVFKNGEDSYSVEELVAQILGKAQEFAQDATNQVVQECVIIVPGFFGQSERLALLQAAKLANLKVLQLINDYTAVGLNYGIFQRKEINETAQYFMFYDMGAYKTSASVVSYQLVKDKQTKEMLPVVQVVGVAFDRTLGGLEMQLRLRDYLGQAFNDMKKTTQDVFESPRALAKLFKEAGRVKNVLSANSEHYAQVEGLLDEKDFKFLVTREKFEELCDDLFKRVPGPLNKALSSAGLTLDVIKQVILFGGGTRTPKVQEILKDTIKQELGKNLNADEGATMGAVYRAADLATGFKVKKYITKDAVVFPIQVVFERDGDSGNKKPVYRTLFGNMNAYPQKKVITFNKHKQDFAFYVNYAEMDHLSKEEISYVGSQNLSRIQLMDVAKKYSENVGDHVESKGIKAHFILDDSGIFSLANVDLVLDKSETEVEDEGTLSKLGSTISKLFGGDDDNKVETEKESDKKDEVNDENSEEPENKENEELKANDTKPITEEVDEGDKTKNATEKSDKPKIVTLKIPIPNQAEGFFVAPLMGDQFAASLQKLYDLNVIDQQKARRENAINALESFVIEANVRMGLDEYIACATTKEIETLSARCVEVADWIYEDGMDAAVEEYDKKLDALKLLANDIYARHWEHDERPEALKAFHSMVNGSEHFLTTARNLTKETNPEKDVFTQTEVDNLEKAITETVAWREKEVAAQNKLAKNEPVRLTVKAITDKMSYLDREVKYLVNKIKMWRPKTPPKEEKKKKKKASKKSNETAGDEEEVVIKGESEGDEAKLETPESEENVVPSTETPDTPTIEESIETIEPIVPTETTEDTEHTEL